MAFKTPELIFMTTSLWIGFSFLVLLVVFLIVTSFVKDHSTPAQYSNLRFLSALCAGFAGGFLTGEALFKLDKVINHGVQFSISGTAGCALFFAIWFTYPKRTPPVPPNIFKFSIPVGWTFLSAIDRIVKAVEGVYEITGFTDDQLNLILDEGVVRASSPVEGIRKLRFLCRNLPQYNVTVNDGIFTIEKI